MRIRTGVGQILGLVVALAAHAQPQDPLHSKECDAARAVLEQALDDGAKKETGSAARLANARKAAIAACLGPETGERQRSGAPDPPIAVAPPAMQLPRAPAVPAIVASPAPPPMVIQRPTVITTCDPGGCWDTQGNRLNTTGPVLIGPRGGACTVQGGLAHCP